MYISANMALNKSRVFSAILITCLFIKFNSAIIRPSSTLSIIAGEGFVTYLEVSKHFGDLQNCSFQFKEEVRTHLDLTVQQPLTGAGGETILPFSEKICGLSVNNVSPDSAGKWTLVAQNLSGVIETGTIKLTIQKTPILSLETTVQSENGDGFLSCSKDYNTNYCQIKNLNDGQIWDSCSITTVLKSNMQFQCLMFTEGRLNNRKEIITIENKKRNALTLATMENTADHLYLRCKGQSSFGDCHVQKPQEDSGLLLTPGLYDGRFSAFDTDLSKWLCTLDILKPIEKNEVGVWRIIGSKNSAGCLYYVGDDKQKIIKQELDLLNKIQKLEIYNTTTKIEQMSLTVPFIATACFLRSPNNNLYYPDAYQFERTRQYGNCIVKNLPVESGIWMFGAIGPDYDGEFTQSIDVVVKSKLGEVLTKSVFEEIGWTVDLMCKSAFREPIENCAFINPSQEVTLAAFYNFTKNTGRIKYLGSGLQNGECGIKIEDLEEDDFGEWICQFTVLAGNRQTSLFKIHLGKSSDISAVLGQASTLGLSVGLSTIVVVIVSLVILSYFFKRRAVRKRQSITSDDPLEMVECSSPTVVQTNK